MGEWLTTGEMIDRLKVGEVAEVVASNLLAFVGNKVKFKNNLQWVWMDDNGRNEEFYLSENVKSCKWRILPKYVTFEEAKNAYEQGKKIKCTYPHYKNENIVGTEIYSKNIPELAGAISWHLITKGKWQIIE